MARRNGSRAPVEPARPRLKRLGAEVAAVERVARRNLTVYLSAELVEEISHACGWLSGPPQFLTRSGMAEDALSIHLERLRRLHNGGKPFTKPPGFGLRRGRPVKAVER